MPSKQPSYRNNRLHSKFAANLPVDSNEIKEKLLEIWGAHEILQTLPREWIKTISREKYSKEEWTIPLCS
jgi:hypothetical protein